MIPKAIMESTEEGRTLRCGGEWTIVGTPALPVEFSSLISRLSLPVTIECGGITELDTVGAFYLYDLMKQLEASGKKAALTGLKREHASLFKRVEEKAQNIILEPLKPQKKNVLVFLGEWGVQKWDNIVRFLAFFGEIVVHFWKMRAKEVSHLWRSALKVIQTTGCEALPIVALMSFLVGVVIAYQLGVQLELYGANIYVVDASGIAILREFAPLMTAVIIAGRTSTAFAALIGTMKIGDELDALATMGVSPVERLVLPRVAGVVIVLPLLVVWAIIFSIFGSMVMAKGQLHIGYVAFLTRFQEAVDLKHYVLGMVKTPVFALIISIVGCFQGFQTGISADSVGLKTTAAAVQSIFLIIIADAFFSVLYSWRGL